MEQKTLYRYFEGTATPEEMQEIKAWSEESADNKKLLRWERKLFDAIIISGSKEAIEESTNSDDGSSNLSRHSIGRTILRVAAIVLLTAGITTLLYKYVGPSGADLTAMQKIVVPQGQRVNVKLPDGTDVWLNSNTTLEYANAFGSNNREVKLDGEGYFGVKHDDSKPFIVHTQIADVTDLGTKFNVEAYSKDKSFKTSLLEGKVSVSANKGKVDLKPNEMLSVENGKMVKSKIDNLDEYRWREGLYCFHDKLLSDVMNDFENYYCVRVTINSPSVASYRISGKFRLTDGLNHALKVLQMEVGFNYTHNGDDVTIQ